MVFGKIEYLNLLPFHIFMKRYTKSSQELQSMNYYGGVPANINDKFISRRVDAAFISSIKAKKYKHINLGIIAKDEVLSVLVIPSQEQENDIESASSNLLSNILNIKGKVLIGDKALKYSLQHDDYIDLALEWKKRYNSPFVFALLCYHKEQKLYKKIEKHFLKQKIKIPQYILKKQADKTDIKPKDVLNYLNYISYDFDKKADIGVRKFYRLSQKN
jgi:chorismate dehydratase